MPNPQSLYRNFNFEKTDDKIQKIMKRESKSSKKSTILSIETETEDENT